MDISAQKRVEEELRVREEEYRIAVRQSDKFVFRYDIAEKTALSFRRSRRSYSGVDRFAIVPAILRRRHGSIPTAGTLHALGAMIVSGARPTGSAVLQLNLNGELGRV